MKKSDQDMAVSHRRQKEIGESFITSKSSWERARGKISFAVS